MDIAINTINDWIYIDIKANIDSRRKVDLVRSKRIRQNSNLRHCSETLIYFLTRGTDMFPVL